MCGIAGIINLKSQTIPTLRNKLNVMSKLIQHRGPDGEGIWTRDNQSVGFAHRRLSILDLSSHSAQPMQAPNKTCIIYNGEVYNYLELQSMLSNGWNFSTTSDTEVILATYEKYAEESICHLRGMFAFALWDEKYSKLICARDRFGIKPFYYTVVEDCFIFASEAKALLPFLPQIETDVEALADYFSFQYPLEEKTLFSGIKQLLPGHMLIIQNGKINISKYWDVNYLTNEINDFKNYSGNLEEILKDSIRVHLRSDVPVASYLSGGVDSSLISILACEKQGSLLGAFHGKFTEFPGYDESSYAESVANQINQDLYCVDIKSEDFREHIKDIIYHLDYPIAGPGAFPQYMVSKLASQHVKVILGGQGGDEIFGGYARYVIAYLERALLAEISPDSYSGLNPSLKDIIPGLSLLKEYIPMIKDFWAQGLFDPFDERYFRLCDRSKDMEDEINWDVVNRQHVFERFQNIFNQHTLVKEDDFLNKVTRFDFKCLLPALLQVEDRMSMAHGLESRVPFLDHKVVEFMVKIPSHIKFQNGQMKHMLRSTFQNKIPKEIFDRRDKMGFPVPLKEWFSESLHNFVGDILSSSSLKERPYINKIDINKILKQGGQHSRKIWGLLSLELWHQNFHDRQTHYKKLLSNY